MQTIADQKEKKIVIKAINNLGGRVSAADISAKTGLPLASATFALNQIAAETSGHMQVSPDGDIAYKFPIGYQTAYISRGIKRLLEQFGEKSFHISFFLLRISFGVMLILSLVTIVLVFVLIMSANSRSRDNDDFKIDLDFFDWMILRDLLFWQLDSLSYGGQDICRNQSRQSNFLYSCFSFLFGDGNPNINIEERRWRTIAELIRQNQGAVVCEQLAPYIGKDPSNEDTVLPVLVRFNGKPTVTDSGNIVYLFPDLQAQAIKESTNKLPSYLERFPWEFSRIDNASLMWVIVLAVVNFLGSWYVYFHVAKYISLACFSPLFLILVIYGTLFVTIPLIRYLVIQSLNERINKENKANEEYARALNNPDTRLSKKLTEAEQLVLTSREIKADNLVYDTQKDVLEQEFRSLNNA